MEACAAARRVVRPAGSALLCGAGGCTPCRRRAAAAGSRRLFPGGDAGAGVLDAGRRARALPEAERVGPHPLVGGLRPYQAIPFARRSARRSGGRRRWRVALAGGWRRDRRAAKVAVAGGWGWPGSASQLVPVSNLLVRIGRADGRAAWRTWRRLESAWPPAGLLGALRAARGGPRIAAANRPGAGRDSRSPGSRWARKPRLGTNPLVLWRDTVEEGCRAAGSLTPNLGRLLPRGRRTTTAPAASWPKPVELDPTRPEFKTALDQLQR